MAKLTLASMILSSPGLSFADEKKTTDTETPIRHVIVRREQTRPAFFWFLVFYISSV